MRGRFLALARNDEDTYKENLIHAYTLIRQREFQTVGIPDGARLMDYYQGLDALLHMEQSKLRAMTDDVLMISLMGLNVDCYATSKANCVTGLEHRIYASSASVPEGSLRKSTRNYANSIYNTVRLTGLGKGPSPFFFLSERRQ